MTTLTECNLAQVVAELLSGKTMIFPTETSYGLGCDATNQAAVEKIFSIKGRRPDKAVLVVAPTAAMAQQYVVWNPLLAKIAARYWPGPLTVVGEYAAPKKNPLVPGVVAPDNTVAVRVSAAPLLKSITEKMQRPLVATSANLAGAGDSYSADELRALFAKRPVAPDYLLDSGILPKRPPTTIVRVYSDHCTVLRQGEVTVSYP